MNEKRLNVCNFCRQIYCGTSFGYKLYYNKTSLNASKGMRKGIRRKNNDWAIPNPTDISQVTFARNCFSISTRLLHDMPEIVDLCVIKCVESVKILCVRRLDFLLSIYDAVELILHS